MEGKEAIIAKITENARLTADNIVRDAESERDAAGFRRKGGGA